MAPYSIQAQLIVVESNLEAKKGKLMNNLIDILIDIDNSPIRAYYIGGKDATAFVPRCPIARGIPSPDYELTKAYLDGYDQAIKDDCCKEVEEYESNMMLWHASMGYNDKEPLPEAGKGYLLCVRWAVDSQDYDRWWRSLKRAQQELVQLSKDAGYKLNKDKTFADLTPEGVYHSSSVFIVDWSEELRESFVRSIEKQNQ